MNLFGPIFSFEVVRTMRRSRHHVSRALYVSLLLILIGLVYLSLFPRGPQSIGDFLFSSVADRNSLANFGAIFFLFFSIIQLAVGTFASCATASAVMAEEKERQTLPFLLTTTLADREILLGKLAARVAQIGMVLMAGVPVLAIMQFMGGVDPNLLLASYLILFASMVGASSVAAAVSVTANTVKAATSYTTAIVLGYLIGMPFLGSLLQAFGLGYLPVIPQSMGAYTLANLVELLNSGNPVWLMNRLPTMLMNPAGVAQILPGIVGWYVAFHAVVAAITLGWASLRLRKILARQADRGAGKTSRTEAFGELRGKSRRAVFANRPVLWRETCTAVGKRQTKWLGKWVLRALFALSFTPVTMLIVDNWFNSGSGFRGLDRQVHDLVRGLGTAVLVGTLFHVAGVAGGSIGRERRQRTFDDLALTAISNREIIGQKLLAAVWSARFPILWVALHWLIDLIGGGLNPLALLLVPPLYFLYLLAIASLGMLCAVNESPKFKPGAAATLSLLALFVLPWGIVLGYAVYFNNSDSEFLAAIAAGFTPPSALGFLTLGHGDMTDMRIDREFKLFVGGLLAGIFIYLLIGYRSWRGALKRFALDRRE